MSGSSFATKGLVDGGAPGGVGPAPIITFITPTPSTTPGDPGGMSSSFPAASDTPILVDVTPQTPATLSLVMISVRFLDGTIEVAYRGGFFTPLYAANSYLDGTTFHVRRTDGWPGGNGETAAAIEMFVDATDSTGAYGSADVFFLMPTENGIARPPVATPVAIQAVDVVAAGLARLIWQFRS